MEMLYWTACKKRISFSPFLRGRSLDAVLEIDEAEIPGENGVINN